MHLLFPAAEVARMLQAEIEIYRQNYQNSLIDLALQTYQPTTGTKPRALSIDEAAALVFAMVQDSVNDRMIWIGPEGMSTQLERRLGEQFPGWDTPSAMAQTRHFFDNVVDPFTVRVQQWINFAIPERSWNIWHVRPLGQDVILERGEDYRIVDWHRMMQEAGQHLEISTLNEERQQIEEAVERDFIANALRERGLPVFAVESVLRTHKRVRTPVNG